MDIEWVMRVFDVKRQSFVWHLNWPLPHPFINYFPRRMGIYVLDGQFVPSFWADSTYQEHQSVMGSENIMDELASLIRTDIPEGRQNLKESFTNLERVAEYCEDTYYR